MDYRGAFFFVQYNRRMPFVAVALLLSSQDPVLLRLDPSAPAWNYKSSVSIELDYTDFQSEDGQKPAKLKYSKTMESTVSLSCIKSSEDQLTWKWTVKAFKTTGALPGSNPSDKSLVGLSSTVVTSPRGEIISTTYPKELQQAFLGVEVFESPSNLILPEEKVGAGSTWKFGEKLGDSSVPVNYTLKAIEKINAFNVALIESNTEAPPSVRPVGPVKTWVDLQSGRMIRATGAIVGAFNGVKVRIFMTVNKA